jgi:hypothetical protein
VPAARHFASRSKKHIQIGAERIRKSLKHFERGIPPPSFDTAYVRPVEARAVGQFLLAQAQKLPVMSDDSAKVAGQIHVRYATRTGPYVYGL